MTDHAKILLETFSAHGIKARCVQQYNGPSVTLHAFQLDAGQSVKSVLNIAQDLAVAVGQESVRILAPIPDTTWIGVEVPNQECQTVDFKPATVYGFNKGALRIPIGVDVKDNVIDADLTKLPHLLIAGATGSGKSVALNTIITALIARNTPEALRLHLIDPKRVELNQFANAPQVDNIVTDLGEAETLLEDLVDEMDRRYELFENACVRNIAEYNERVDTLEIRDTESLPFQVLIIDEMADLMMQRKKTIEPLIVRLAQLARAAGIHLILATQRPTVDVITGLIKANVPSRLSFAVASVKDSTVILDQTGAQALTGQGDGLYLPMGQQRPSRIQGPWTSDEVMREVIAESIKSNPRLEPALNLDAVEDVEEDDDAEDEDQGYDFGVEMIGSPLAATISDEPAVRPPSKLTRQVVREFANTAIAFAFLVTFAAFVIGVIY